MASLSRWILTVSSLSFSFSFTHSHTHTSIRVYILPWPLHLQQLRVQSSQLQHTTGTVTHTNTHFQNDDITHSNRSDRVHDTPAQSFIIRHSAEKRKKIQTGMLLFPRWIWLHKQRSYGCAERRGGRILRRNGWENESSWEHFYCTTHVLGDVSDRFRGICGKRANTLCARVSKEHQGIHKMLPSNGLCVPARTLRSFISLSFSLVFSYPLGKLPFLQLFKTELIVWL